MLNESVLEKLAERLVNRIEEVNSYTLEVIGKRIKQIGTLSTSQAQQLIQTLKYGGDIDKITKKLAEITELNVQDIYDIFEEVAKNDLNFAEKFYKYRGLEFTPYENNIALQNQVSALSRQTAKSYLNLTNTLAFTKKDKLGKVVYTDLFTTYRDTLDKSVLSVSQGKSTFQEEMYKTIKELGNSGIKTVDYSSRYSRRLDSAVRSNMMAGLRDLHNNLQEVIGEDFGYDGVEISVHENSAPDHIDLQGKQFSLDNYSNLQNELPFEDYQGEQFEARERGISELNCYHYIFSIILGVSEPRYSEEELKEFNNKNEDGFSFDGNKYTNYEGLQLQRKLEVEIRKQKDIQIIAKNSGNKQLIGEAQTKITQLTSKYRELSKISGLPTKMDRLRVSGYRRVSTK